MTLKLEDICPEESTFKLKQTGKTYTLRPISLDDEMWLLREFPTNLQEIFNKGQMKEISRIVFHQLINSDKEDFLEKEVIYINEQGKKLTMRKGGADLLNAIILGPGEKMEVIKALVRCLGVSRPLIDDAEKKTLETIELTTAKM